MTKLLTSSRFGRTLGRSALRAWGRLDKAPGYLCRIVDRFGPELAEPEPIIGSLPNGCRIGCDLRDHVQRWIWFHGTYEPIEAYLFTQLLKPGYTVIDAGANAGQYTLLAATAVGDSGSVHSFEPVPATFARLERAVIENCLKNVVINRVALWHEETTLHLGVPEGHTETSNAGTYSVRAGDDSVSQVEAPALRLDTYVAQKGLNRVDLIKMDIEGGEPAAIAGALQTLERFGPTILMEICPDLLTESGSSVEAFWNQLSGLGYRFWRVGLTLDQCKHITNPTEIGRGCNAILHQGELPPSVTSGWKPKAILRWARSGW